MHFSRFLPTARTAKPALAATTPAPNAAEAGKARIKAIFALDGAEDLIRHLALDTDLSVDQAKAVLAKSPKPGPARATIAERAAQAGNLNDLGVMPRATAAAGDGWDDAVARVNAANGLPAGRPGVGTSVPDVPRAAASAVALPRARAEAPAAAPAAAAGAAPVAAPHDGPLRPPAGVASRSPAALAERLPEGRPRETFRAMGDSRAELHAVARAAFEARERARNGRNKARDRVAELTDPATAERYGNGQVWPEDHQSVVEAREQLAKAEAEYTRADHRHDIANQRFRQVAAFHDRALRYLETTPADAMRAWKGSPAVPQEGETVEHAVARVRDDLARLHADLHETRSAPLPFAEAWPKVAAEVERLAEAGQPDVSPAIEGREVRWPSEGLGVTTFGDAPPHQGVVHARDGFAFTVWLHKAQILKKLKADLEAAADDGAALSTADRRKREADILDAILAAERAERDLIDASAGAVEHRPAEQIDPRALLYVEGPALADGA